MKKDLCIIGIIVIIIAVLISSFVYTRPQKVLERTIAYDLLDDSEIVESRRFGVLYWTQGFQMKVKIKHEDVFYYMDALSVCYSEDCIVMPYEEYMAFANTVFTDKDMIPVVDRGTNVAVSIMEFEDGSSLMHVIVSENTDNAYMYVYWYKN